MSEPVFEPRPRSRRALLAAAAGVAAAAAATVIAPATALATDPDDVAKNQDNATTAVTSITQTTDSTDAFQARGLGTGVGVIGRTDFAKNAGVVGLAGDPALSIFVTQPFDIDAGIYGYSNVTGISAGILAEGPTGVYGTGDFGVYADGFTVGLFASAVGPGTAVQAHAGTGLAPAPLTNAALMGTVSAKSQIGIYARGRAVFPDRSGRTTITKGHASKTVSVANMTSGNAAYAVLNTSRTGVYVRAVVPGTGKITIYLNKAVPASTSIAWLVLG
jgi:hypothetical protein